MRDDSNFMPEGSRILVGSVTVAVYKFFDGMRKGEYLPNKEQRPTKDVADFVFIVCLQFLPTITLISCHKRVNYH